MKKTPEPVDMSEAAVTRRLDEVRALYKLMQSFRETRDGLPKDQRLDQDTGMREDPPPIGF